MTITINFATADDLEPMADLLAELFTLESDFTPEREKQINGLRLILDKPHIGRLFVLRVDEEIAGMANALITVSTVEGRQVVLLEDLIVKKAFRSRQLGRLLVEHIFGWAAENGMPRVTLLADQNNAPALAFYQRLGFTPSAMQVLRRSIVAKTP